MALNSLEFQEQFMIDISLLLTVIWQLTAKTNWNSKAKKTYSLENRQKFLIFLFIVDQITIERKFGAFV